MSVLQHLLKLSMKLLFIITTLIGGGAERVASILCNQWSDMGHDVTIVCTSHDISGKTSSYALRPDLCVIHLAEGKRIGLLKKIARTRKIIKQVRPDIMVSFLPNSSFIGGVASFGYHIPMVVSERNDPARHLPLWERFLRKLTFSWSKAIVFQTGKAQQAFSARNQKKSVVITNPVDALPLKTSYRKAIIAVGRFDAQKRYDYMIRAFSKFWETNQDYCLEIYGDGAGRPEIERQIEACGLSGHVSFMGFSTSIRENYPEGAFYIMSSLYEGVPNALIEACMSGLPAVSSDFPTGSAREIIEDGYNGYVVPINADPKLFGEKMCQLADALDAFRVNAADYRNQLIKRHDPLEIAKQWEAVFVRVLRK